MSARFMLGALTLASVLTVAAFAHTPSPKPKPTLAPKMGPQAFTLPPAVYDFKDGPNLATVRANCLVCHGAEYVYVQPPFTAAVWTAEVNKMRNAYKANIADADIPLIVDYLMTQNGKPAN